MNMKDSFQLDICSKKTYVMIKQIYNSKPYSSKKNEIGYSKCHWFER